jgi:hypothetical protein
MKFFQKGIELKNLAKCFDETFIRINELEVNIQHQNSGDIADLEKDLYILAYFCRKEILDRMEEYNWPMDKSIIVQKISEEPVTLTHAYQLTLGRLCLMAGRLSTSDCINDILELN